MRHHSGAGPAARFMPRPGCSPRLPLPRPARGARSPRSGLCRCPAHRCPPAPPTHPRLGGGAVRAQPARRQEPLCQYLGSGSKIAHAGRPVANAHWYVTEGSGGGGGGGSSSSSSSSSSNSSRGCSLLAATAAASAPVTLPRGRLHSVGAPGNGTLYCGFYDRPDTGNYADFLTKAYGGYGKFAIFPDNVSYHKSRRWGGGVHRTVGRRIRACYFPTRAGAESGGGAVGVVREGGREPPA